MFHSSRFSRLADRVASAAGSPIGFVVALTAVVGWAISGSYFEYSDRWLSFIATLTAVITFLMVFLIQHTQARDQAALQTKLDELIRASGARNHFIGIDQLPMEEVDKTRRIHDGERSQNSERLSRHET